MGGLYEVKVTSSCELEGARVTCGARGGIRQTKKIPTIGDHVDISSTGDPDVPYIIDRIHKRRNILVRPPVSNLDTIVLVFACKDPVPDLKLLDKMLIISAGLDIRPVIVFTKEDLEQDSCNELRGIYSRAGYDVFVSDRGSAANDKALIEMISKGITGFAGPSGVGKSTLINSFFEDEIMKTGSVSDRLKRGKHTTRHVELVDYGEGYVIDTPGFTSLSLFELGVEYTEVVRGFPEIAELAEGCRFDDCRHINERDCAVKAALEEGTVDPGRYERYKEFYEELYALRNTYGGRPKK